MVVPLDNDGELARFGNLPRVGLSSLVAVQLPGLGVSSHVTLRTPFMPSDASPLGPPTVLRYS
jgi:hypothetical protein